MSRLVVIYYHSIVEEGKGYSYQRVEKKNFNLQMKYLKEHGYRTLLFEELIPPIPERAVLVTFDDGFRTIYDYAVSIMDKYEIKGNIFLPTKYVEEQEEQFMTWDMIREICNSGNYSVAAHTHSHVDIRTLNEKAMREEVEQSNQLLKNRLNIETKSFCMPYGKYNSSSIKLLKKCSNYQHIFASYYGHVASERLSEQLLPRIGISNDDSIEVFQQKLEGKLDWKGIVQKARLMAANLTGERITRYDIV